MLFTLEAPLCAIEEGGSRTTEVCLRCGRGHRKQTSDLRVSLVCQPRTVWLTDASAIVLDNETIRALLMREMKGVWFRPVQARWRPDLPWANEPLPSVSQLLAETVVHAARGNVELEGCECGSVRSISYDPLLLQPPGKKECDAWFLAENPEVLILGPRLQEALLQNAKDLDFASVWFEDEYQPSVPSSGIDWGDL